MCLECGECDVITAQTADFWRRFSREYMYGYLGFSFDTMNSKPGLSTVDHTTDSEGKTPPSLYSHLGKTLLIAHAQTIKAEATPPSSSKRMTFVARH